MHVDIDNIEQQIEVAFLPAVRGSRREAIELSQKLGDLASLGESHLDQGEMENALAVFAAVGGAIRRRYEEVQDSEGEIAMVIDRCLEGLDRIVDAANELLRPRVLAEVLENAIWGRNYGVGTRAPDILVHRTNPEERKRVAAEIEGRIPRAPSEYERQFLGRLLAELRGGTGDIEAEVDAHRRAGNHVEVVQALLRLHRPGEASKALAEVQDWFELRRAADLFEAHGYPDHARRVLEDVVEERRTPARWIALEWLHRHAASVGDARARARWAEELFWDQPTVGRWNLVRESVRASVRTQLRKQLEARGQFRLVAEILLVEGKPRWALKPYWRIAERTPEVVRLGTKIAEGIAKEKPKVAAELWLERAEQLVANGRREDYAEAVEYVKRGADALLAAGHPRLAKAHVEAFRAKHRRRATLQEVLDELG